MQIPIPDGTVVIGVTQSGESADTLVALRGANRAGAKTHTVINVVLSSAVRASNHVLYIRTGPENGVAATKTFASQVITLAMLTSVVAESTMARFVKQLRGLSDKLRDVLDRSAAKTVAEPFQDPDAFYFIDRKWSLPVALEGALKMKEITYRHAKGFPAGEFNHGPLALVEEQTPVFAIATDRIRPDHVISSIKEVQARGAPVVAVTDIDIAVDDYIDAILQIPEVGTQVTPVLANVQLQVACYWVARFLGRSIAKPRNMAKSVTVK